MSMVNISYQKDARVQAILNWLRLDLGLGVKALEPASSDASFRRYFRISISGHTYIVMDAPPGREDIRPFVKVARLFRNAGVSVPEIINVNEAQGFLLLSDLGSNCYLERLDNRNASSLYRDALDSLLRLQQNIKVENSGLPHYDELMLRREMGLFGDWFLRRKLEMALSSSVFSVLDGVQNFLVASAMEQPFVCVHRDYHSRNLMILAATNPGVLDFQDAVIGPITYDLVSLLRDCYIAWDESRVKGWVEDHFSQLSRSHGDFDLEQYYRWFELMGLQRHLKAIGIFSRLDMHYQKPGYLADIPRTLDYVIAVSGKYPELADFNRLLQSEVIDRMNTVQ